MRRKIGCNATHFSQPSSRASPVSNVSVETLPAKMPAFLQRALKFFIRCIFLKPGIGVLPILHNAHQDDIGCLLPRGQFHICKADAAQSFVPLAHTTRRLGCRIGNDCFGPVERSAFADEIFEHREKADRRLTIQSVPSTA
jgi:hypothetical protein